MGQIMHRLVFAALLLTACNEGEAEREERAMASVMPKRLQADGTVHLSEADAKAVDLRVAPAVQGELPDARVRWGRIVVQPGDEALLVAPLSARISSILPVAVGSDINAGTTLLNLTPLLNTGETVSLRVQTAELDGQLRASEQELILRDAAAKRAREPSSAGILSTQAREEIETAMLTARAHVEALRRARAAQLAGGKGQLSLQAPIAGRLIDLDVTLGAVVQPGDILARVLRGGARWVDIAVAPDDTAGSSYEVQINDGWVPAQLVARGGFVGPQGTRRDRLEITGPQAQALLPGATVAVRVVVGASTGILVPESALVAGVGNDIVYVETSPGIFTPRPVHVAARFGGQARLTNGLVVGTRVVVQGAMSLRGESLRAELRHME